MTGLDEQVLEHYHRALVEIVNGSADLYKAMLSQREDVTLANPFGTIVRGRAAVAEKVDRAAANYTDGEATGFDLIAKWETPELACLVEAESFRAKVGGRDALAPLELRVTSVFRLEDGAWRIVHRHADPITTERPAEAVLQT